MSKEFDPDEILLEMVQKRAIRTQAELAKKKVEVGQIREFIVGRGSSFSELNGAEIRVTGINQESGIVEFELTDNNDPVLLENAKDMLKAANIEELFDPKDISLEEMSNFRTWIEQAKIEIGKSYINKKPSNLPEKVRVLKIDYINRRVTGEFQLFGRPTMAYFDIKELGEEVQGDTDQSK